MATTETHLIHNADDRITGTHIRVPVSAEVPAGYVPFGSVEVRGSRINHVELMERAGYAPLYRRADGMVVARDRMTAFEVGEIIWSRDRIERDVYVWAPTEKR